MFHLNFRRQTICEIDNRDFRYSVRDNEGTQRVILTRSAFHFEYTAVKKLLITLQYCVLKTTRTLYYKR